MKRISGKCIPYCYSYDYLTQEEKPLHKLGCYNRVIDEEKVEFFSTNHSVAILTVYKDNRIWLKNCHWVQSYNIFVKGVTRALHSSLDKVDNPTYQPNIGLSIRFKPIYERIEKRNTGMFYIKPNVPIYRFVPTSELVYELFKATCEFNNTMQLKFMKENNSIRYFHHDKNYDANLFWNLLLNSTCNQTKRHLEEATFIRFSHYASDGFHKNDALDQLAALASFNKASFVLREFNFRRYDYE